MQTKRRWLAGLLVFGMVLAFGTVAHPAPPGGREAPDKVDPYLWQLATESPDALLPVILLMDKPGRDKKGLLHQYGGKARSDFDFVNGLNGELPAGQVLKLSKHPQVARILYDAPVKLQTIDAGALTTIYGPELNLPQIWNGTPGLTGRGVTVAVMDTGVSQHPDFQDRLIPIKTNKRALGGADANGHGTHVAGIIAGRSADGRYIGVAPEARVVGVKIADDAGKSTEGDLLAGLQWVWTNRTAYNIRVVNLSLSGSAPASYKTSPLAAAAEQLWKAGIVVVAAAGNRGSDPLAVSYPPGNDPRFITVGALDDNQTLFPSDDSLATFSSRGITQDGYTKPEIVAPGRKIVAPLASTTAILALQFPDRIQDSRYIRLSGTSMAAPVVSGIVALLLQVRPDLTPDQVKWVLMQSARPYANQPDGTANLIDVQGALDLLAAGEIGSANDGLPWNVGIDQTSGQVTWSATYWDATYWDSVYTESNDLEFSDVD